ncbi:MAG TPA: hypothetical protein VFU28_25400 [Vicinamibacterales bacterium]|nr:hypothetical protein [Vicinamibacterales bacterium]
MSRVSYANTPSTIDQETLRTTHRVRIVSAAEEGTGVNALPGGVYGFTYSPGLANAPLFAERRFRSYETHKLANGDIYIIGFADVETAAVLVSSSTEQTIQMQPEPDEKANVLVKIPYTRIRQHRQYAAPNQHGFTVTIVGG